MTYYQERDIENLGIHYTAHVEAMTTEGLHSKADIAAELGYRDEQIDVLQCEKEEMKAILQKLMKIAFDTPIEYYAEIPIVDVCTPKT
jgi:hypothetical protein